MNSKLKRSLIMIMCLSLIFAFSVTGLAYGDTEEVSWSCGDGVKATYSDGELTIRPDGNGIMWDFDNREQPWKEYAQYIKVLSVYGDLKRVGNYAFADLPNLYKAYFRGSIDEVGKEIFKNCPSLEVVRMVLPTQEEAEYIWFEQAKNENFDNKIWKTWEQICDSLGDAEVYRFFSDEEPLGIAEADFDNQVGQGESIEPDLEESTGTLPETTETTTTTTTKTTKSITLSNQLMNRDTWELISLDDFKGIKKSAVYTGKKIKFDITSDKLEKNVDYKVSYKNNRKLGQAEIIIEGIGKYDGTIHTYFKIKPRGTSIKTAKLYKKYIKVTWKKQPKNISGYEIQYSTDPSFKDPNIHLVKNKNSTSTKIRCGIKSGKKYYVRIRTYKADGMIITDHSKWSKVKKVKKK